MPEGLYWYHPHMRGELQAKMLMGLSGAIIVEGPAEDARREQGIVVNAATDAFLDSR